LEDRSGLTAESSFARVRRATRSLLFFLVYGLYLVFFFGLVQRLLIWPLAFLLPTRRLAIVGAWFRLLANSTLALARTVGGVRLVMEGAVAPGSCVVVMNHQSLLDIPIAYSLVTRPYPLIPTRALYARGIPGVSLLLRLGGHPLVRQTHASRRRDVIAIARAAEQVAEGKLSILIFPEGHRTRDGQIGPFMKAGLRSILARANRPVYAMVVDGLWAARTTAEALLRFSGMRGQVKVLGPFPPPAPAAADAFADELRERMARALVEMREEAKTRAGTAA
jgi:1-acyl-sn-glycerol-3-phosphate acyltransferase